MVPEEDDRVNLLGIKGICEIGLVGMNAAVVNVVFNATGTRVQGLEDSGVAPSNARNGGAVLPASRTWQVDSGIRLLISQHFKVIAGVFELEKLYFNLDTSGLDRELGVQQARGIEVSIAGQILPHLDLNAGVLSGRVRIHGANLAAEGIGPIAVAQPRLQYVANANYTLPFWPALSLDLSATHFGSVPESVRNDISTPAVTELNLGGRLKFCRSRSSITSLNWSSDAEVGRRLAAR